MLESGWQTVCHTGQAMCLGGMLMALSGGIANAVTVKVVPWVASDATIAHDTFSGKTITLKGTADVVGNSIQWTWDFGDGSPVATGTVTDNYVIEAQHAYTGADGTLYTARLTVLDTTTGNQDSKPYYVLVAAKALNIEVNVAIDEALWHLHKDMTRWNDGSHDLGSWDSWKYGYSSGLGFSSLNAENVAAFETQGHLESGSADNPYTETVQRGLRRVFERLAAYGIPPLKTIPSGTYIIDLSGSGVGLAADDGYTLYQGGMFIDCIIASGTPNAVAVTGNTYVKGRKYSDIVQDLVDWYLYSQYEGSEGGGWRYSPGDYPDNSVCQWAAIGLIPAEREWNLSVPQWAKDWNEVWLRTSQDEGWWWVAGGFPYTPNNYAWGPFATTPSGMVQMCMDHIGRGSPGWPNWDAAETVMRDWWDYSGVYGPKGYYYGSFSFVKSMLLHWDINNNAGAPIVMLQSSTPGVVPIDWYAAETANGAPSDGMARTLVNSQDPAGFWWGHNVSYDQYFFETAWATMMLSKTIFHAGGVPVAVPKADPSPALANQTITLDGSKSFDKATGHNVVKWEWDLNNDGTFDATGPVITTSYAALGIYPVTLRVTDDSDPPLTAEATLNVLVTVPPVPPTANAGGPYVFCPAAKPWFLDGRMSINPDDGKHEPGSYPSDKIQSYLWDLVGNNTFSDAAGSTPDVTSYFTAMGPGTYVVQLKVTDITSLAFPSSGLGDLFSVASATVIVKALTDTDCSCITLSFTLNARDVQLSWTPLASAASYAVYRGSVSGGPYIPIGTSTGTGYTDITAVSGQTYYYVVRPRALNNNELCQSNEQEAHPLCALPTVTCAQSPKFNSKYYRKLTADSACYDDVAHKIYIGDTSTPGFQAGPYKDKDVVCITKSTKATVKAGAASTGVAAIITVKGQAKIWAVDPQGETGVPIIYAP